VIGLNRLELSPYVGNAHRLEEPFDFIAARIAESINVKPLKAVCKRSSILATDSLPARAPAIEQHFPSEAALAVLYRVSNAFLRLLRQPFRPREANHFVALRLRVEACEIFRTSDVLNPARARSAILKVK
jgi:hypothetical protein